MPHLAEDRAHPPAAPAGAEAGFVRRLRTVLAALCGAYERWLQRQALAELDDRLLADIGVTRREAERECAKGFRAASRGGSGAAGAGTPEEHAPPNRERP